MSSISSYSTGYNNEEINKTVCLIFPPNISSPGLAASFRHNLKYVDLMNYYVGPGLAVEIILIFVLTIAKHAIARYLGLPVFISQILAGITLRHISLKQNLFAMSKNGTEALGSMAAMGYVFFLFLNGVKMDASMAYKSGRKAICFGILTMVVPVIFCLATDWFLYEGTEKKMKDILEDMFINKSVFLAISYSGTSFPVIHILLSELKILNSQLGRLGLSAALVGDMLSQIILNVSVMVKEAFHKKIKEVLLQAGLTACYVLMVVVVFHYGIKWIVKHMPDNRQMKDLLFYLVFIGFLMTPWITKLFNVFILFGPFLTGLAIPDGPPLGSALVQKFDPVISALFLPLFAATCGMRVELFSLNLFGQRGNKFPKHQAIVAVVAVIVKFVVSLVLPLLCNMPTRDSFALAFILISKGIVEIGSYSFLNDSQVISEDLFMFLVLYVLVIASIVPNIVKILYEPSKKYVSYQKRSLMYSKANEALRVLGCIHLPGDVHSIINILNAFHPTKQSPIAVDVLHLFKLSGQATPVLTAHKRHNKSLSTNSCSENVVISFNQFEQENRDVTSVNVFSAVCPPNLMYEDVCNLAMDRLSSFMILPFHRRWHINGDVESDDETIKTLNYEILEKAPCSVGILIERRRHFRRYDSTLSSDHNSSSYSIAVIFLGGKDDREALSLANRMSQDTSVSLTVIRLKDDLGNTIQSEDRILDDFMLKKTKENTHVKYHEERVNTGSETSDFLRSILDDYQLIIVGRRYNLEDSQTTGLKEWTEFQEIGLIGDLLISPDFGSNYAVLIVQQQLEQTSQPPQIDKN